MESGNWITRFNRNDLKINLMNQKAIGKVAAIEIEAVESGLGKLAIVVY